MSAWPGNSDPVPRRPADDVAPIAIGQRAGEDRGVAEWGLRWGPNADWPPVVLDTDLLSTTVYAEHYYGACPEWIKRAARARMGSLYLLCEPDLPWSPDGVRDRPTAAAGRRHAHHR